MAKKADLKKLNTGKGGPKRKQAAPKAKKISPKVAAATRRMNTREADPSSLVLDRLWNVVMDRRDADPSISHSARLLSRGITKVAQKFGEEAVECLIEAVGGNA